MTRHAANRPVAGTFAPTLAAVSHDTQARVAALMGVDRSTVSLWWDTSNVSSHDTCRPDARVKVTPDSTPTTNKAGLSGVGWWSPALLAGGVGDSG